MATSIYQQYVAAQPKLLSPIYTVNVDSKISMKQMIKNGDYSMHQPVFNLISDNDSPTKIGQIQLRMRLSSFQYSISSEEAVELLTHTEALLRLATFHELLSLLSSYPDLARDLGYPIAALGSVWHDKLDNLLVPFYCSSEDRELSLFWFKDHWFRNWRFACVVK